MSWHRSRDELRIRRRRHLQQLTGRITPHLEQTLTPTMDIRKVEKQTLGNGVGCIWSPLIPWVYLVRNNSMASSTQKLNHNGIPRFEDLPLRKGDPHHSAWGLYGKDDELGTLNRLTDERVVEAARTEIKSGVRSVDALPLCFQEWFQMHAVACFCLFTRRYSHPGGFDRH